jgi:hypothetical protein
LLSANASDIYGGSIHFFSSDGQLMVLSPQLSLSATGFNIADQLSNNPVSGVADATWNPANAYLTVHQAGNDNCVVLSNGSTGYYRLNPNQSPQNEAIFSPFYAIQGGCGMVRSIKTSTGVHKLLIGGTGTNQNILMRDLTTFTDNGTPYPAYATVGGIPLCSQGQIAAIKFLALDFAGVGSFPTVSILLNGISSNPGDFTQVPFTVMDPAELYGNSGTVPPPKGLYPLRFDLSGVLDDDALPRLARSMFFTIDFGTDSVRNEAYNFCIFGRLFQNS